MESFLGKLRWVDFAFIAVMAVVGFLAFRLFVMAWKKEKEKIGKK